MGDFSIDTELEGTDGHYSAQLSSEWAIWGPNGGYLAAIAMRAAAREARIARPAAFSCHFLSVARFDTVELQVTSVRRGRRAESLHVTMTQEGKPILFGILRTASPGLGLEHDATQAPEVRPPEALKTWSELFPDEPESHPFWKNLEAKPTDPEQHGLTRRALPPVCRQWNRFRPSATFKDPVVDAARALLLIDTMGWPAASRPHVTPAFQAPNLDVSVWFHASEPDETWLLSDHHSPIASGGLMGVTGRVWSRSGTLLASGGAQLMCVPMPSA